MLFIPFSIEGPFKGIPFLTILVMVVCILLFQEQLWRDELAVDAARVFCAERLDSQEKVRIQDIARDNGFRGCVDLMESFRATENKAERMVALMDNARPLGVYPDEQQDRAYHLAFFQEQVDRYFSLVPDSLTNRLAYDPHDLDVVKMLTATFSHGSWAHLIGNLLFFFVFSLSVEQVLGTVRYAFFFLLGTAGTNLAYSFSMRLVEDALPTIGLSGLVMAVISALAVMLPLARIRCFFWFFIYVRIFRIPAMFIALWFVGWDLYEMNTQGTDSMINYTAHVSGALCGAIAGVIFRFTQPERLALFR